MCFLLCTRLEDEAEKVEVVGVRHFGKEIVTGKDVESYDESANRFSGSMKLSS